MDFLYKADFRNGSWCARGMLPGAIHTLPLHAGWDLFHAPFHLALVSQILFKMKSVFIVVSSAKLVREGVLACSQGFAVKSVCWDDAYRQMGNEEGQWSCAKCCTHMRNHRIPGWFVLEGTVKLS